MYGTRVIEGQRRNNFVVGLDKKLSLGIMAFVGVMVQNKTETTNTG